MGPPSYMRSIADRNVFMRSMTVPSSRVAQAACVLSIREDVQAWNIKLVSLLRFDSLLLTLFFILNYSHNF